MIVNRLEIQGFKRYGKLVKFEFPDNCGTLAILGPNEVGKSSLFQSIEFALYGLKQKESLTKEDIITWGKEKTTVEMEFTVGNQRYLLRRELRRSGSPRVKLIPIVDGRADPTNAISTIREVEDKIEDLLGLNNDSFRKLLYIRQKDLDALKDLYKSQREQSLNKVMGIDLFDDSAKLLKSDLSKLQQELEIKKLQMKDTIAPHKESYDKKVAEKGELRSEISKINEVSSELKINIKELEGRLTIQDWKLRYTGAKELEKSTSENLGQMTKQESELEQKSQTQHDYIKTIDSCSPEHERLTKLCHEYQSAENRLKTKADELKDLHSKEIMLKQEAGLSEKHGPLDEKHLTNEKKGQLRKCIVLLIIGITISISAIFVSLYLLLAAIAALILCVLTWRKYQKADELFVKTTDLRTTNKQATECEALIKKFEDELEIIRSREGFARSEDINDALSNIIAQIKLKTGMDTIQALVAVSENLHKEIIRLQNQDIGKTKTSIESELERVRNTIRTLEIRRPVMTDDLSYDEREHNELKEEYSQTVEEWNKTRDSLQRLAGQNERLDVEVEELYTDYCQYPVLEKEIQVQGYEISVLERVVAEYSETAKELRTKVIPYAKMYINNILPTLTGGRYSNFEITEDLQFKAYSAEAGQHKDRDVFSGGTQDQFLIALRLAFTQSILNSRTSADKYCILMDECISSSDENRKEGIFEVLRNSQSIFSQIFIIAHENVERLVDHSMVLVSDQNGYTAVDSKTW